MYIFESPKRLGPIGRESQGYLGSMKHKSHIDIFGKLRDVRGHDYQHIGKSPGYLQIP